MTLPNRTIDLITGELHVALTGETANAVTVGGLLAEAKARMQHGQWLPWLKNEFSMSKRSAQQFMKAATFVDKYAHGAHLKLSRSALFLISRYDQREIADAVITAAKETLLGCDQAKEIINKALAELKVQPAKPRSGITQRDQVEVRFTVLVTELDKMTKGREADRFAKCPVGADIYTQLAHLFTEVAKAKQAAPETDVDRAA